MSTAAGPQNTLAWELPKRVVASPARKVEQPFDSAGGHWEIGDRLLTDFRRGQEAPCFTKDDRSSTMLCLKRKVDESIVLDLREWGLGLVNVMNLKQNWEGTRLGIEADPRIPVHRLEVFEAIERNNAEANNDVS